MARRGGRGSVTATYLADPNPFVRGVGRVNKAMRSLGRGANLNAVARDVSKVSGRMGGMLGMFGRLRMGWFGVGSAATVALGGVAAAIQRVGNEYDQAITQIQRATGMGISEVEGMERAFQNLAGSVPESMGQSAAIFGQVVTDMSADLQAANREMSASSAEVAAELSRQYLQLGRITGLDPARAQAFAGGATFGQIEESRAIDALAWAAQNFAGLPNQQLWEGARKARGTLNEFTGAEVVVIAANLFAATGNMETALESIREIVGQQVKLTGETPREVLERMDSLVRQAMRRTDGSLVARRRAAQGVLARPTAEGGFGLTTHAAAWASAFAPTTGPGLVLGREELAERIGEVVGARLRESNENITETWARTLQGLEVEFGPQARQLLLDVANFISGNLRVFQEHGIVGLVRSAAKEVGARMAWGAVDIARTVIGDDTADLWGIPDLPPSAANPVTRFDLNAWKNVTDLALEELARSGEMDLGKLSPHMANELRQGAYQTATDAFTQWRAAGVPHALTPAIMADILREDTGMHGVVGPPDMETLTLPQAFRHRLSVEEAQQRRDAAVASAQESELEALRMEVLTDELTDLAGAAGGATQALYEMTDGAMLLADGVIFKEREILAQGTDPDGITTTILGGGGLATGNAATAGRAAGRAASAPAPANWPVNAGVL